MQVMSFIRYALSSAGRCADPQCFFRKRPRSRGSSRYDRLSDLWSDSFQPGYEPPNYLDMELNTAVQPLVDLMDALNDLNNRDDA